MTELAQVFEVLKVVEMEYTGVMSGEKILKTKLFDSNVSKFNEETYKEKIIRFEVLKLPKIKNKGRGRSRSKTETCENFSPEIDKKSQNSIFYEKTMDWSKNFKISNVQSILKSSKWKKFKVSISRNQEIFDILYPECVVEMNQNLLFRLKRIKKAPDRLISFIKNFIMQKGRILESLNEFLNFGIFYFSLFTQKPHF